MEIESIRQKFKCECEEEFQLINGVIKIMGEEKTKPTELIENLGNLGDAVG